MNSLNSESNIRAARFIQQGSSLLAAHLRGDFDGGDVRHRVDILHRGVVHVSVGELHADAPLIGHDVSVGHDESVTADDEARSIGDGHLSP